MNSNVNATTPAGQQLLFDWTQSENRHTNQSVAATTDNSVEAARDAHRADLSNENHYGPNHPWHYLGEGDNAPPVPFDDIPPAKDYGNSLERELPKPAVRRIVKAREILAIERRDLEQARTRYEDVIARGADALSRFDREIAYGGNDELARAGTLALLFNQIAWRRGRIAYLEAIESQKVVRRR